MPVVPPPAPETWIFDIFSWEHLSAALTVFTLLLSTAVIPVFHMFKRRTEKQLQEIDKKETEKIQAITTSLVNPLADKVEKQEDLSKDIYHNIKLNEKGITDLSITVQSLIEDFKRYKDEQADIIAKLSYLEGMIQRYNKNNGNNKLL